MTARKSKTYLLVAVTCLLGARTLTKPNMLSLSGPRQANAATLAQHSAKKEPIFLIVSAIWEGRDLKKHNLDAIKRFRQEYDSIRIMHHLSPAYFLRDEKSRGLKERMTSTFAPGDRFGVSLYGWKSVVEKAGLVFRSSPTFWGNQIREKDCARDCGQEVALTAYRPEEIMAIVGTSRTILKQQGFDQLDSLAVGGWLASPAIYDAMAHSELAYSLAAVSPTLLKRRLKRYPLYHWLADDWQHVTPLTQPYVVDTASAPVTEIGNSAATIDYLSVQEIVRLFEQYTQASQSKPDRALTFHLGFYQESAHKHLPRLSMALQKIFAHAQKSGINLRPITLPLAEDESGRRTPALRAH